MRSILGLALLPVLFAIGCGDGATTGSGSTAPAGSGEIEEIQIAASDFVFDALAAGPDDGEPVLLLHGFPSSNWQWEAQLRALGTAGYRAIAPNQRGYSPGARPQAISDYQITNLIFDALNMADALGWDRFHLVGHDWGAGVAWGIGVVAPNRLLTLNPISVPHPDAFAAELADPDSCQASASGYFNLFVQPGFEETFIANDNAFFRSIFDGVPPDEVERHVALLGNSEAMRLALNWYRANVSGGGLTPQAVGSIRAPTMFIWSDEDFALCREGAEATGDYIDAPYRFEIIEGVNHWVTEIAGDEVAELLVSHLDSH